MEKRLVIIVAASAMHLACEDRTTESVSTGAGDPADEDIVRISDVHALDLPLVELRLIHSTAALPDLHLDRVAGAVFLPDSALIIGDGGARELVFLDGDGSIRARSGRDGEGPGEYRWIERVGVGVDGMPFVFDRRLRRFTFLDADGDVTRIQRLDQGAGLGAAVPLSRLESGEVVAALETRPTLPPGLQRGPVFLVLSNDLGEIVDTVGEWAGKERYVTDEWLPVGFARTALFAGRGSHALAGTTDSLDLTLYHGVDPVARLRGGYSPRRVTVREKEEWTERFLEVFPEDFRAGWRRRLERSTIRDFYPTFGAIKVDADGRIWIGDYPKLADELRRWTIIEPDGTQVAAVNLPVLFPLGQLEATVAVTSQPVELLDVAHGRIAVLRRDEFDVEVVEVYEMGSNRPQ
ncbi:hypothetical protein [Candidatus Palauibacter soopunensis]|uniref:hypothetical protein n=1 Tax=Candidatus Palauibacter soopunensis TaxID=3056739 RepID=UPI0023981338|nr:hypothetical protein [Candidatus Palauibacter soopunensis]MDE2879132.1 hypothetical protein [Candidatus Palauibacter soopunensis]